MKIASRFVFAITLLLALGINAEAQQKKPAKKTTTQKTSTKKPVATKPAPAKPAVAGNIPADATQNEKKVRDIVAFLQYMLNMLGSSSTATRDKDVMVTESYSKIFADNKVQIEDDLDDQRETVTNKEVMAYLKDVDFFFTDAQFEFTIEKIEEGTNANGKLFYKVITTRNLKGTTSDGKAINLNVPRFIEINYNQQDQDLKIASIYTHEIDERAALTNWWRSLSYEWQSLFKKNFNMIDSVSLDQLKNITALDSLNLANNTVIQDITPLSKLINLQSLNLSHTSIRDLTPIRNLTELTNIDLSYTPIQDISALKYSAKLQRLSLRNTQVSDISVLTQMPKLQSLDLTNTPVVDFTPIASLGELTVLNLKGTQVRDLSQLQNLLHLGDLTISNTPITDLTAIQGLKTITTLHADSTKILSISALSGLENLKILYANHTGVADLQPLIKLTHLEKIYVDQAAVNKTTADAFMKSNPKVLVVYNSSDLMNWWSSLSTAWQDVLSKQAKTTTSPSKEELATITSIDSINVHGIRAIADLDALRPLQKIKIIQAQNTSIKDLSPIKDHKEIVYLDVSETDVADLSVIKNFAQLKELHADKSKVETIEPLAKLTTLKKLYVDQTAIHDITAREFLEKNPDCLLVYKTIHLTRWWKNLTPDWKKAIRKQMGADTTSTRENLHRVVELQAFHIENVPIRDLAGLTEFVRLKELHFSGTAVTEIPMLENLIGLKVLHATNGPLQKIDFISQMLELEDLDISNTPIDELKIVGTLKSLKSFNCSGTQVKKLSALEYLTQLHTLDCSNTFIGQLDPVSHNTLKTLKCYNTKVSAREIENFKKSNPNCDVVYYR